MPYLSTSEVVSPDSTLNLGKLRLPLSGGGVNLLRRGEPFWNRLLEGNIPVTMVKLPVDFPPPPEHSHGLFLSGLGTPDVRGSQGSFTFFTDDPRSISDDTGGGVVIPVRDYGDGCYTCRVDGPPNSLIQGNPTMSLEVKAWADRNSAAVRIDLDNDSIVLGEGQWSPWMRFGFPAIPGVSTVHAIGRFYLKEVSPKLKLYLTPLNIDPENPALPVPARWYSRELAERTGPYYTQGFPEDTKALSRGIFNDDDYLSQANLVFDERMNLFDSVLSSYREGLLFFYFSSLDLNIHMFFRSMDPASPLYGQVEPRFRGVVADLYSRLDIAVGRAMELLDDRTEMILMSDHGFAPFRRSFNLNSFLAAEGFASIGSPASRNSDMYACLDWSGTGAYGLGLNGLYINQAGRERDGVVPPEDRRRLMENLKSSLESATDPYGRKTGKEPVHSGRPLPRHGAAPLGAGHAGWLRHGLQGQLGNHPRGLPRRGDNRQQRPLERHPLHIPGPLPRLLITTLRNIPESPCLTDMGRLINSVLLPEEDLS